jgi:ATP-binding cassette subfamily F protein uup
MTILSVENLGKSIAGKLLFDNASFSLDESDRVGLIGDNGSGKTTLLRIVSGEEPPDSGRVMLAGNPIVGYLSQNPVFDENGTVLDAIFAASSERMRLVHDYEAACHQLSASGGSDEAVMQLVADLAGKLEAANAWELETNATIVLDKLGITDTTARISTLSGGQRKRVALAHALVERPDLLILDEPTNHLDADTITWLESYLARYSGALLLVTHDRYFLDRVTNRIIEIDRGTTQTFAGNFSYYLEKKAEQAERDVAEEGKRQQLIRQELEWLRRGPKARTTKAKARIDRAHDLMAQPKLATKEELAISLATRRLGSKIIEINHLSKAYGDRTLINDFTYILQRGDRLGVIGPNGTGKTTLLEIITGRTEASSGDVAIGETVVIGYYDQESRALADDMRVIDYVREGAENIRTADGSTISASQMLERFLFPSSMQYAPIGKLSGGERRRLYLLRILMGAPNVLILDEPTNDLDISTLEALEDYLDTFPGCLIVVSHDRYFLDRTVDHLFRLEGEGRVREYPGNYSAYLDIRSREESASVQQALQQERESKATAAEPAKGEAPRKLSFKERKELDKLEKEIAAAEEKKMELEAKLSEAAADYVAAQELSDQLQKLTEKLDADMVRWAELAELA